MRILNIVHQYLPEQVGGTELYTHWLARGVQQGGHQVAVFTRRNRTGQGWEKQGDDLAPIYAAWAGELTPTQRYLASFHQPALVAAFNEVLDDFRPDLVHVQHLLGLPVGIIDLLQARRLPYAVTFHDFWWLCANANLLTNYSGKNCGGPVAHLNCTRCVIARAPHAAAWVAAPAILGSLYWRNHLLRKILQGAAKLIAPSDFVKSWYVAHGVNPTRLHVLASGVEQPPATLAVRRRHTGEPVRLLYLGGIAPIKGIHIILEALRQVQGAVELWVAGDLAFDPVYTKQLRQTAAQWLAPQVKFLGRLDRVAVWETLAQVDALVAPSLWQETYCFVVREAFAAGVPVIASDIGALHEAVRHNVDGLLVSPGDVPAWRATLQSVVDHPARLEHLRSAIRRPLDWEAHTAQVLRLYTELI